MTYGKYMCNYALKKISHQYTPAFRSPKIDLPYQIVLETVFNHLKVILGTSIEL